MNPKTIAAALVLAACALPAVVSADVTVGTHAIDCMTDDLPDNPALRPSVSTGGCSIQVRDGPQAYEAYCSSLGSHAVSIVVTNGCDVDVRA